MHPWGSIVYKFYLIYLIFLYQYFYELNIFHTIWWSLTIVLVVCFRWHSVVSESDLSACFISKTRVGEVPKMWFVYQIRHNELYVYIFFKYKKHEEMSMKWVFLWNTILPFYPITYLQFYFCLILLSQPHYPI